MRSVNKINYKGSGHFSVYNFTSFQRTILLVNFNESLTVHKYYPDPPDV